MSGNTNCKHELLYPCSNMVVNKPKRNTFKEQDQLASASLRTKFLLFFKSLDNLYKPNTLPKKGLYFTDNIRPTSSYRCCKCASIWVWSKPCYCGNWFKVCNKHNKYNWCNSCIQQTLFKELTKE